MSVIGTAFIALEPDAKGFGPAAEKSVLGSVTGIAKKAAAILTVSGGAFAAFGVKAANTFSSVGGEVSKLSRLTGDSADEMSRLRFAANQTGIDSDKLGVSIGILSKHLGANDKAAKSMGVAYRDAKGNALPFNKVLLGLSERFKNMPNGIDKNRLAMQLFGKAGTDLIPFLNKGKAGLEDLEKAASKFGVVLTQDNLDAIKKNTIAHREFDAAMEGVQLQVGQYVLPILTKLAEFGTATLLPALVSLGDIAKKYLAPAFQVAFDVIGKVGAAALDFFINTLLPGAARVFGGIVDVLKPVASFVMNSLWPAFKDSIGLILGVLNPFYNRAIEIFDGVRSRIQKASDKAEGPLLKALHKVGDYVKNNLAPILAVGISGAGFAVIANQALNAVAAVSGFIAAVAVLPAVAGVVALIAGGFIAIAGAAIYAYTHFKAFRDAVDGIVDVLQNTFTTVVDFVKTKVADLGAYFDRIWPQIQEAVGHAMRVINDVITGVLNVIGVLWRAWGESITAIVQIAFDFVMSAVSGALEMIRGIIQFVLAIINGDWGKAWDALKQIVAGFWKQIVNIVSTAFVLLGALAVGFAKTLLEVWNGLWSGMKGVVDSIWVGIQNAVRAGINGIITAINVLIRAYNELPFHKDVAAISKLAEINHSPSSPGQTKQRTPALAGGGDFSDGALVGERGIELLTGRGHITSNADIVTALKAAVGFKSDSGGLFRDVVFAGGATVDAANANASALVRSLKAEAWRQGK